MEYDQDGILKQMNCEFGTATPEVVAAFFKNFPWNQLHIEHYKKYPNTKVKELELDLSFENFWNLYDHKLDKKSRTEKIWNTLSKIEKAKALAHLPRYETLIIQNNVSKKYPSTYLNSRIWDQ
jgi:hypothetical protein